MYKRQVQVARSVGPNTVEIDRLDATGPGTLGSLVDSVKGALASLGTTGGTSLNLAFKDCGDASTHAKVKDISPHSVTLGTTTTVTGTGSACPLITFVRAI